MDYDKENDFYICKNNQKLTVPYEKKEKRQPAIEELQLSINVPTAVVVLIKRIALKAIIAKHQWNSVVKHCMFQKP